MGKSYFICWDRLGNRAVIECGEGLPVRGILVPDAYDGSLASDIGRIDAQDAPFGGMLLDTRTCIGIMMEQTNGITVRNGEVECGWEPTEDEKRYLAAR